VAVALNSTSRCLTCASDDDEFTLALLRPRLPCVSEIPRGSKPSYEPLNHTPTDSDLRTIERLLRSQYLDHKN